MFLYCNYYFFALCRNSLFYGFVIVKLLLIVSSRVVFWNWPLPVHKKWVQRGGHIHVPHLRPKSLSPVFISIGHVCAQKKLANKERRREEGEPLEGKKLHCVVPNVIHTSPIEGIFP